MKKIQVVNKIWHENKNERLRYYKGEFEMFGRLKVAVQTRETHIRFRNIADFESYVNAIDQDYESEDTFLKVIFIKPILLNLT